MVKQNSELKNVAIQRLEELRAELEKDVAEKAAAHKKLNAECHNIRDLQKEKQKEIDDLEVKWHSTMKAARDCADNHNQSMYRLTECDAAIEKAEFEQKVLQARDKGKTFLATLQQRIIDRRREIAAGAFNVDDPAPIGKVIAYFEQCLGWQGMRGQFGEAVRKSNENYNRTMDRFFHDIARGNSNSQAWNREINAQIDRLLDLPFVEEVWT